ncbi:hypothetical protein ACIRNU_34375 [Streptomyces rochei]|uniref:hypothetical protein n=1 Tax=Streptomyces rochei TaxID=1928 RepID=UPI0037F614A6
MTTDPGKQTPAQQDRDFLVGSGAVDWYDLPEDASPSPADELRGAAEKLRALGAALRDCQGPWYVVNREQRPYPQRIDNIGVPYVVASTTTDPSHPPTIADYICAMHPGVGAALADWLETTADYAVVSVGHPTHVVRALTVARQINGESK